MLPSTLGKTVQLDTIPQGRSSKMDSDTLDGFQTSPAANPSPGTIVPLDTTGQFHPSVIPGVPGAWATQESQTATASSTNSFNGLTAGTIYRLSFVLRQNTANGRYQIRFNSDSGNNYSFAVSGLDATNVGVNDGNNGVSSAILLSQNILAGKSIKGEIEFSTDPSDGTIALGTTNLTYIDSAGFMVGETGGIYYDGATTITSMTFLVSAGTFTGTFNLQRIA